MSIALDATYSAGSQLTGVGVYCGEILQGLGATRPSEAFTWAYRPHRFLKSWRQPLLRNCRRRLLFDHYPLSVKLFHGLNQRLPQWRARRTVTTFHDLFVLTGDYSTPQFRARFVDLARHAASQSDLIIAVSQFTANQVCDLLHVEPARLRVIPHGVHMPVAKPRTDSGAPFVLSVGAIQKRKNTSRLIQAFQRMSAPWRLVLAGSSGYGADDILRQAAGRAMDRIDVMGFVSAAQLEDLYRRASIFAFPSLDEGFGIPVLEAMAHGIPVIASNTSALPEVCGDAAMLVDPLDVEAIAEALTKVASDTTLQQELASRGKARALAFPWARAVDKTWDIYQELLS